MRTRLENTIDRWLSRPRIVDGLIYLLTLPASWLVSLSRVMPNLLKRS